MMMADPAPWALQVRSADIDRYLSAVLAPATHRPDLLTLYAFDAELARIPASVSEPLLGEIRLQWWRDALTPLLQGASDAANRTGNPLADAIADVARRRRLNAGLLHGLIDARSTDLADQSLADEQQLWAYLAKTEAAVLALGAQILGWPPDVALDRAAEAAGRVVGLVRIVRRLLAGAPGSAHFVPLTIWPQSERDGGAATEVEAGDAENGHAAAAQRRHRAHRAAGRMLDLAETQLPQARAALAGLPAPFRAAFLPAALVPRYLTQCQRWIAADGRAPGDINPLARIWTLWRAKARRNLPG